MHRFLPRQAAPDIVAPAPHCLYKPGL